MVPRKGGVTGTLQESYWKGGVTGTFQESYWKGGVTGTLQESYWKEEDVSTGMKVKLPYMGTGGLSH
jgi:hypothetical protein